MINDLIGAPILEEIVNNHDKISLGVKNSEICFEKRKENKNNNR